MTTGSHEIRGGDYVHGGSASSSLKESLKKIGVEPADIRRAMIAAYEAEMNVVIHAHNGRMHYVIEDGRLEVEVIDEGPGIPDIDQAMQEGFSTAPPEARDFGFGAGMGLPNIKKNTDRLAIESLVGQGTQVRFTVFLRSQGETGASRTALKIISQACTGCLNCLRVCPTGALRVRNNRPIVLEHLCINCPACVQACTTGALRMATTESEPKARKGACLVVSDSFLTQFGPGISTQQVIKVLSEMGFSELHILEEWKKALRKACILYARENTRLRPVISPLCVAVVNLIQTRFPSLLPHLAPFLSPVEAVRSELGSRALVLSVTCPCQYAAALASASCKDIDVVSVVGLRGAVMRRLATLPREPQHAVEDKPIQAAPADSPSLLEVSGIRHVLRVLEEVENGLLGDVDVLEPCSCDQGCFGSPLFPEDAFVSRHRLAQGHVPQDPLAKAVERTTPLTARPGMRLDADMSQAIDKLARIDALHKALPGTNCGLCGAPSCLAFAEDVVMGRADRRDCARGPHDTERTP